MMGLGAAAVHHHSPAVTDNNNSDDDDNRRCKSQGESNNVIIDPQSPRDFSSSSSSSVNWQTLLSNSFLVSKERGGGDENNEKRKFMVGGHRGTGMNALLSDDHRMKAIKENSILSFTIASSHPNLDFLEFDVQLICSKTKPERHWRRTDTACTVTKDDCPVIFHDSFIMTQHQGDIIEKRVTELSVDELLSYGPQKEPCKVGKPLFRKSKDGRVLEWKVEKDDPLCTFEDVFQMVDPSVGFDIELKFDDYTTYEKELLRHILRVILDVVNKYNCNQRRPLIFSSFHPDAVQLIRTMQDSYPVFFITKGGIEMHQSDPRRNSLDEAIKLCLESKLHGIVSESRAIFRNLEIVHKVKDCKLSLLTYGQLNNVPEAVYAQYLMGLDGVVVDFVPEITEAVSKFLQNKSAEQDKEIMAVNTRKEEEDDIKKKDHKAKLSSERDLSFLLELIPELVQA